MMGNEILVSVIVPCFNATQYIARCIDAFEKQSFQSFEVIFIDDCSTDNTYEMLQKTLENVSFAYQVIQLEQNSGPGVARNVGISKSKGPYVSFCDIDDTYEPSFLSEMYDAAIKSNADIVMCNSMLVFPDGSIRDNSHTQVFNINETKEKYIALSRTAFWYLLVRKTLFDTISIPAIRNGEDIAVVPLLMQKANNIKHIDSKLYCYYINSESVSNKPKKRSYYDLIFAFKHIEENWGNDYLEELEFLGVKTIVYSAMLIGLKAGISPLELKSTIASFQSKYANWHLNKYLSYLPQRHKLFISLIHYRLYIFAFLFSKAHTYFLTRS